LGTARKFSDYTSLRVAELLELDDRETLAGWSYGGAVMIDNLLEHRWRRSDMPDLVIDMGFEGRKTRCYRRIGDITISYMNLGNCPYPFDQRGEALFDALELVIRKYSNKWEALQVELSTMNYLPQNLEERTNRLGYSICDYRTLSQPDWLGSKTNLRA